VEEERMSQYADLADLHAKHHHLELELQEALAHPASSDEEIAAIKRQKLKLKDDIVRLERLEKTAA
jgi:hypothetical protein